jgi:hypothetical protein
LKEVVVTKICLRTLSLAAAIAMMIAPVMAQARLDPPTTPVAPTTIAGAPQQTGAPAPSSGPTAPPSQHPGSLQGFGPMQANPLLGTQPMQSGGGKW